MRTLALVCLFAPAVAQVATEPVDPPLPKVGDAAPALAFDHVLGGEQAAFAAEALRDKVVVLEFSTSWCGGCRAAAPHWREVVAACAGQPIAFLTVTNEDLERAQRFRSELAMTTPLAIDLDGSLFEALAVPGLPDVVVLGKDGRIAAFTTPFELDAAELRKLAAGETAAIGKDRPRVRRNWNHQQVLGDVDATPGTFLLAPTKKPTGIVKVDPKTGTIRAGGVPLVALLSTILDCSRGDIELDPEIVDRTFYDLVAWGKERTLASTRALARACLLRDLALDVETNTIERDVLVLQSIPGKVPPAVEAAGKGGIVRNGEVKFPAVTPARLAAALASVLPRPVVDETGIAAKVAVDLQWDPGKGIAGLRAALADMGLSLADAKRGVPMHHVRQHK